METDLAKLFSYWKRLDHEMLKLTALCSKVVSAYWNQSNGHFL